MYIGSRLGESRPPIIFLIFFWEGKYTDFGGGAGRVNISQGGRVLTPYQHDSQATLFTCMSRILQNSKFSSPYFF
jgi:hypothetical protein